MFWALEAEAAVGWGRPEAGGCGKASEVGITESESRGCRSPPMVRYWGRGGERGGKAQCL